jgi:hypothetical protein
MNRTPAPRAITMWDFSWLERRWPGAGYEDWGRALDQACERGYDAIRIDAFPHLAASAPGGEWTLLPVWSVNDWGSPVEVRVRVLPSLHEFVAECRSRGIKVGLSTWYREDSTRARMRIDSPETMAEQWNVVLAGLEQAGLLDGILYVDLCNEWPGDLWAPFFRNDPPEPSWGAWHTGASLRWMRASCERVRARFPDLPVGYSFEPKEPARLSGVDLRFLDYADPHLWMAQANGNEFADEIGYRAERFNPSGYETLSARGEGAYRKRPGYWQARLREHIRSCAGAFRPHRLPLMTTECWGLVDYKDGPGLDWGWEKDLCRIGVETACSTGQWLALATSNFAGPQFRGMWRDVAWHRELTSLIRRSPILPELQAGRLYGRL